jgi:two-component system, chemotaxis family, sensor kinase CheA
MMQFTDAERAELLATFRAQAVELLATLEEGLLTLERAPQNEEALHAVFRAAHTIKGDARIVGFDDVAQAAHALEDVLEQLRERTLQPVPGLISALLAAGDALRGMIATGTRPEHQTAIEALTLSAAMAAAESSEGGAAPEVTGNANAPAAQTQSRTLRVDVAKLDRLLDLAGEIAIARGRLGRLIEELPQHLSAELTEMHHFADALHLELQEQVMRSRMVAVGPFLKGYQRTVRDLVSQAGKQAVLEVEGEDVEVDMRVLDLLRDPVSHMVRNALDHGLEDPELRAAVGKSPSGTLVLAARRDGAQIVITIKDDGAGFDLGRIAARVRELGLHAAPEQLPRAELLRFVFEPGFSTAEVVTELSGRGVGMDVVRRNVEALRGTIEVASEDGQGSIVTIRLPLTLAIIDGFAVGVGEETYILPLHAITECLALPADRREDGNGLGLIALRGGALPFARIRTLLGVPGTAGAREEVVVVEHDGERVGLVVDALHGEGQAVIKALGRSLDGLPGLAGSTLLGNGRVALILDVPGLLRRVGAERLIADTVPTGAARA